MGERTIKTQMFGTRSEPKALKNHRWELIFFWFRSLRRKITCVGTMPLSGYLHRPSILRNTTGTMRCDLLKVQIGIQPKGHCVLKHVGRNRLIVDLILHVFALIHTQRCETIEYSGMDLFSTVRDDADNYLYTKLRFSTMAGGGEENLLPALWPPDTARFALTEMGDVLHDPIERSTEENFILLSPKSGRVTAQPVMVRTLYIVITMNSSVWRPFEFCRRLNRSLLKSSGSQVTAVYLHKN